MGMIFTYNLCLFSFKDISSEEKDFLKSDGKYLVIF